MEEVTEIYQDPLAFLKNLGLEFAVDNDVVREVYEQQHTQKTEIQTHLKVKEIRRLTLDSVEIIFNNERSVEENQILAQRIYQYGFSNIANIRYGSISMDEFYFASFNSEEELNNMID